MISFGETAQILYLHIQLPESLLRVLPVFFVVLDKAMTCNMLQEVILFSKKALLLAFKASFASAKRDLIRQAACGHFQM